MEFTIEDIRDRDLLERLVARETEKVFNSPKARRGRCYEEVEDSVRRGKIAELFLVESGEFTFADKKWHDLKNRAGEYVEVKAYDVQDWTSSFVTRDIERYRTEGWNLSTWYYLFQCKYGQYKLLSILRIK
jgi:hypothetical protein